MLRIHPVLLIALCSASICFGQASNAAKEAKVEEVFRVSHMDTLLSKTLDNAAGQAKSSVLRQMFGGATLPPNQQKIVDEFQQKLRTIIFNTLSWQHVKPIYVKLYMQNFSDAELDGLIAFYKSPAGQALLNKAPGMMDQAMQQVKQQFIAAQPQIQQLTTEYQAKVKAAATTQK